MDTRLQGLISFLNGAHSAYHAVEDLVWELEAAGYTCLTEGGAWDLLPGGKYYLTRGGSTVIAFRIPQDAATGFLMSASHSDRPGFKIKENPQLAGAYTRLAVERYGGMIMHTWTDRPLSVAGRVVVQTAHGVESRLVDIDRDLLLIPNVAIHMNRQVNDGFKWDPRTDVIPLAGDADSKDLFMALLEQEAGGKILGHDLYLYVRQPACVWGLQEAYLSAAGLDDLECAWCCTRGFLDSRDTEVVPVLCVFDSEEVGSGSVQGAGSCLLENVLARICKEMQWDLDKMLSQSFMVSADNAHALHPNHPEFSDSSNAPVMNKGVVVKFNANMRYTTDGVSSGIFRKICQDAGIPTQTYCNRADMPGGSTIGCISMGHVSVPTVDVGLAQLAMHSSYETAGVQDAGYLMDAMTAYYGTVLETGGDGAYTIR